ncbi:MAG: amidohydrolase family protein [Alphaproteobacteria bacterium]|nr:amidohydrolase family protein [Alphaproteobacteria bacterium]
MTAVLFENARVLDVVAGRMLAERHVLVENGRIRRISETPVKTGDFARVDVRGRVLMPGLCDGHIHAISASNSFAELERWSPFYTASRMAEILKAMLFRGFTTVRDAGGADWGIAQAVEEGYIDGPRILFCGKALSQTGGHGDMRRPGESFEQCLCCPGLGRICDGVTEIRRAVRDEVRKGATQIKLMVSGGIASPTDRITSTQFSEEEIRAAVEEAEAANIYCMGHAYTARAIQRALNCGVRSIEHGNLLDEATADLFVSKGAFLVPTLVILFTMAKEGAKHGLPAHVIAKVPEVFEHGTRALEICQRRGVKLVYGTDLLGTMQDRQSEEFLIRAEVQKPIDVIRSATSIAAEMFQMEGEIGVVAEGARADLLVVDGDPSENLQLLQGQGKSIRAIMKDGKFYKNELK